jgi:hypothetical protein
MPTTNKHQGEFARQQEGQPSLETGRTGFQGAPESITGSAKEMGAGAGEYADQAKQKVGELASQAAHGVGRAAEHVQEWATTATDKTGQALKTGAEDLARLIRRHPGPALLIGLGLGFLIGRALRS